jgi:uncharacterized membrane protein YadS
MPDACKPGTSFAVKRILRVGIGLMGAQLSLGQVLETGAASVLVVAACIALAILVVRFVSMRMGLSERLGTLLGVRTSICPFPLFILGFVGMAILNSLGTFPPTLR